MRLWLLPDIKVFLSLLFFAAAHASLTQRLGGDWDGAKKRASRSLEPGPVLYDWTGRDGGDREQRWGEDDKNPFGIDK